MRRLLRSMLPLLLLSCPPAPTYVSSRGVRYYACEWDRSAIERQESGFLDAFTALKGQPTASIAEVYVIVHKKDDDIGCPNGKGCNGYQDGKFLVVRDLGSPGASAVTHEMAHYLQQVLWKIDDYDHVDKELWAIADKQYE